MLRSLVRAMRRSTRQALADVRSERLRRRRAPEAPDLVPEVLEVIEHHPDGIHAREIGNELGIDWRSVRAMMSGLVASGAVVQIEEDFYPAGKESRKC